ncbi:MAG: hypothetical protein H6727_11965 [Myxococcales bacterium]|nr:hypothetical protein [Myxococcales bacterium]
MEQQAREDAGHRLFLSWREFAWLERGSWGLGSSVFVLGVLWWGWLMWGLHGFRFDDAFITFRYGENLALGRGVVFNVGERLMGSTAPGHLLLSALVYAIFGKAWVPPLMALLGCAAWGAQAFAVFRIFRPLGVGIGLSLACAVALGGAGSARWVAMETHLVVASALWASAMALEERWEWTAFFAALAALFRPDAALLGVLLGGWCLLRAPQKIWRCAAIFAVVWGPWLIFAWVYFGSPLPQSAATKFQRVSFGHYAYHELRYIASSFFGGAEVHGGWIALVWGLCGLGLWGLWKWKRPLLILPLYGGLHLLAYLYLRPFMSHAWHLYPAVVVFVLCAWCGLWVIFSWFGKRPWVRGIAWLGLFALLADYGLQTSRFVQSYPTHYWLGARQFVYKDVASYLQRVGKKTDRIASIEVGTLAFYSDMPMHDWGGLITRNPAKTPKKPYRWSLVDRLYLKKLAFGLLPLDVFRRSDFTAYLYDVSKRETFSLPPLQQTQTTSPPTSRHSTSPVVATLPVGSQQNKAKKIDCFAFRGAWGKLPNKGQDRGCIWTLAGAPSLTGKRDHLRWWARFSSPFDLASADERSFFVADMGGHRIRKVDWTGRVETWAGGERGSSDGMGTSARFFLPAGLASDGRGGVYVSDSGNARIRHVYKDRRVETIAGSQRGFLDGAAKSARFVQPQGLWRDPDGTLYIADTGAHRIRRLLPNGQVETWAGTGAPRELDGGRLQAGFLGPVRLLRDAKGRFWVTDMLGDALRSISVDGVVSTPLRFPSGSRPFGLALGQDGWLYMTLFERHQVVRWREGMKQAEIIVGKPRWGRAFLDGSFAEALLAQPAGLLWLPDARRLLLVDADNHCIRVLGVP